MCGSRSLGEPSGYVESPASRAPGLPVVAASASPASADPDADGRRARAAATAHVVDEASGHTYYHQPSTGKSQWTPPDETGSGADDSARYSYSDV